MKHPRRTFSIGAIVAVIVFALVAQSTLSANAEVAPPASDGTVAAPATSTDGVDPTAAVESGTEAEAEADGIGPQAGPIVPRPPVGFPEAAKKQERKAAAINKAVFNALKAGKPASFTDVNGKKHTIKMVGKQIVFDGKTVSIGRGLHSADVAAAAASEDSLMCRFKVAAGVAAIVGLGAAFIVWFVGPLAATATVSLAGISASAATWNSIAAGLGAVGVVAGFVHDVVC
jgi:hypothetical protein